MAIALNHLIVPARDKNASARWLAEMFDLKVGDKSPFSPPGHFAVVKVGGVNLDFADMDKFEPHHYAFLVGEDDFDRILGRVRALGITFASDPTYRKPGEINHHEDGRGVYFRDPNGHNLELLTRMGRYADT